MVVSLHSFVEIVSGSTVDRWHEADCSGCTTSEVPWEVTSLATSGDELSELLLQSNTDPVC
jgi:hypothetical protein